jgi:hypothetical protein
MTTSGRRGPKPKKELQIARARYAAEQGPREERASVNDLANYFDVSRRQIELAYKKHYAQVEREWIGSMAKRLTARMNDADAMKPTDRDRYRQEREGRVELEATLAKTRAEQRRLRSRKKQPIGKK